MPLQEPSCYRTSDAFPHHLFLSSRLISLPKNLLYIICTCAKNVLNTVLIRLFYLNKDKANHIRGYEIHGVFQSSSFNELLIVLLVRYPEVESWKKKKRSTTFHSNRLKYDSGRLSCPLLFHDVSPFRHWPTLVLGRVDRTKIKSRGNKSTMERTLAKITGSDWDRPIHESERRKYIKHKTESVSR